MKIPLHAVALIGFLFSMATMNASEKIVARGVPAVQVPLAGLAREFTFPLGGRPDWMVMTDDAVWVANGKLKAVQRIDPKTNTVVAKIDFPAPPCSGLAFGFGSVWVPLEGKPGALARIDAATNQITATLLIAPASDEGSITVSGDSVWLMGDEHGTLLRIDPATNTVRQKISVPAGSFNPLYADGIVWVTGFESNVVTAVDAATGAIVETIAVGPKPRFLTAGGGAIWTLNQGDGSITRIDVKSRRVLATIGAGLPGGGGEICYGAGSVWATMLDVPLTQIDATSNRVLRHWMGEGGDSVRFGHGSIWLTHLRGGLLWRIPLDPVGGVKP